MRPEHFHAIFQRGAWSELHAGSAPRRLLRIWIRCMALWFHHHQRLRFWPTVTFALLWHLLLLTKAHIQLQFLPAYYVCVRECVALGSMWVGGWLACWLWVLLGDFVGDRPAFPLALLMPCDAAVGFIFLSPVPRKLEKHPTMASPNANVSVSPLVWDKRTKLYAPRVKKL